MTTLAQQFRQPRQPRQSRQIISISAGRRKPPLDWTQGRIVPHPILGHRKLWRSKCHSFAISKMLDLGGGPFVAVDYRTASPAGTLIGHHRTLAAAKRACEVRR